MGCDIHGWVEKRVGEKWVAVKELKDNARNYQRFAKLAGVRGDGPEAKGLPDDVSDTARLASDEFGYGHSHSYIDLLDALEIFRSTSSAPRDYGIYNLAGIYLDDAEACPTCGHVKRSGESGYRLVFWFDN